MDREQTVHHNKSQDPGSAFFTFHNLNAKEISDVPSGILAKVACAVDHWDVTTDELVRLAQHLSVPDDLLLFQSQCFRPGYLQDQVV